jgi:AcrR family transcriptional regulator
VSAAAAFRGRARKGEDRTAEVAAAALSAFCEGGYRLTQVAHVAERMGLAVGSIYRYVESKEALFHLAVLEAAGERPESPAAPLRVSGMGETATALRRIAKGDRMWSRLEAALASRPPHDARAEAEAIAKELYASMSHRARLILLLDRCAHEIPELTEIFDVEVRRELMADLLRWVTSRGLAGSDDPAAAQALARGAMEAIAWLAKTRVADPTASAIDEAHARAAAVRIFANAFDYGHA